ncbi:MAG: DUF4399 domain-containing protein [Gammaproteobacteria bacterium]|nr:DUF4399 domain-containing protein [Gammaproteobacteria bacterium]
MRTALAAALLLAAPAFLLAQERTPAPHGAKVFIISPKNGATVHNPFLVKFGLKGMAIAPAGTKAENSGHHHLLIDTDPPTDMSVPLPAIADKVVHFGKGQTETTLTLPPGKHTLQLEFADALHVPHNPPVISKKITVTVAP